MGLGRRINALTMSWTAVWTVAEYVFSGPTVFLLTNVSFAALGLVLPRISVLGAGVKLAWLSDTQCIHTYPSGHPLPTLLGASRYAFGDSEIIANSSPNRNAIKMLACDLPGLVLVPGCLFRDESNQIMYSPLTDRSFLSVDRPLSR